MPDPPCRNSAFGAEEQSRSTGRNPAKVYPIKCPTCGTELWNRRHYGREWPLEKDGVVEHTPARCRSQAAELMPALREVVLAAETNLGCIQCAPDAPADLSQAIAYFKQRWGVD